MPKIKIEYLITENGEYRLSEEEYRKFTPETLSFGDISQGQTADALVSIFDLAGFTLFCDQRDPHLIVPEFLNKFMEWLFYKIKRLLDDKSRIKKEWGLLARLPNFAKFTGDGVLFLWELREENSRDLDPIDICEIIEALRQVTDAYQREFLSKITINEPPNRLRCSIAQGQVVSLGQGEEYVGQCINLASRLAKERQLSFVIAQKGINLEENMIRGNHEDFVEKKMEIDGIGKEHVYILKKEFDDLSDEEKRKLKDI